MTDSVNELALEQIWTIRPSHHQPLSTEFELTHDRPMPLAFAMDFVIDDKTYACLYCGHGKSKVVYKVTDMESAKVVLKLTPSKDPEPYVCQELSDLCSAEQPDLKICPPSTQLPAARSKINRAGQCANGLHGSQSM